MADTHGERLPVGKLPGELLARLIATYATTDPTVVVGPGVGGDAAAIELVGTTLVVKTDPITFATESAPRFLVNVNANDLACLGATARWMMITALLPERETTEALIESLFIAAGAAAGITVTPIGAVTNQPARFTIRAGGTERELPAVGRDEERRRCDPNRPGRELERTARASRRRRSSCAAPRIGGSPKRRPSRTLAFPNGFARRSQK